MINESGSGYRPPEADTENEPDAVPQKPEGDMEAAEDEFLEMCDTMDSTIEGTGIFKKIMERVDEDEDYITALQDLKSLLAKRRKEVDDQITGIVGTPRTGHPGGTSWLAASPYDTACTAGAAMAVGALQTSDQTIMSAAGPLDAGRVQVRVGMSVASSTPAHPDYQDVLTFTAVSTY